MVKSNKRIEIRVSDEIKKKLHLKSKEAGMNLTELLIDSALNSTIKDKQLILKKIDAIKAFSFEFNKIGVNINQIATSFNILTKTNDNLNNSDVQQCNYLLSKYYDIFNQFLIFMTDLNKENDI